MSDLQKRFGIQLKKLREAKGMTQEELANAIGRSTSLISSLERGIDAPSFTTLENLAFCLGIHVKDLFDFNS